MVSPRQKNMHRYIIVILFAITPQKPKPIYYTLYSNLYPLNSSIFTPLPSHHITSHIWYIIVGQCQHNIGGRFFTRLGGFRHQLSKVSLVSLYRGTFNFRCRKPPFCAYFPPNLFCSILYILSQHVYVVSFSNKKERDNPFNLTYKNTI